MTIHVEGEQLVGLIIGAAALLGALGYLIRKAKRASQIVAAAIAVVQRELTPNTGHSMKDELRALSIGVPALSRLVDKLDADLTAHLDNLEDDPR